VFSRLTDTFSLGDCLYSWMPVCVCVYPRTFSCTFLINLYFLMLLSTFMISGFVAEKLSLVENSIS
jgi:hypothetical protein